MVLGFWALYERRASSEEGDAHYSDSSQKSTLFDYGRQCKRLATPQRRNAFREIAQERTAGLPGSRARSRGFAIRVARERNAGLIAVLAS